MTRYCVTDTQLAIADRRMAELKVRLSKGGVNPDNVNAGLQALIEGRGFATDPSLAGLIDAAKSGGALTYVDDNITSKNFPETGVRGPLESVDVGLNGWFTAEKALAALDRLGYRPATMYEGLHYINDGWDRKTTVIFLGSFWHCSSSFVYAGCLWSDDAERELDLDDIDTNWNSDYRFLAVCK